MGEIIIYVIGDGRESDVDAGRLRHTELRVHAAGASEDVYNLLSAYRRHATVHQGSPRSAQNQYVAYISWYMY